MPTAQTRFGFRRLLILAADAIVILYLILDGIVAPLFRPLLRWVARLRLVVRLQDFVAALPPYAILILLAVPIVVAEPAKLYALWLFSRGLFWAGMTTIGMAYVLSLVVAERIYRAGEAKLNTIAWFARLMGWVTSVRDQLLAWLQTTQVWAFSAKIKRRARELAAKLMHRAPIG